MAKSKKKDPSDMITEVEIMYKDCVPGQIMPDGREFLGIKKFPDGVAVAMFNSAKRDPETIRRYLTPSWPRMGAIHTTR